MNLDPVRRKAVMRRSVLLVLMLTTAACHQAPPQALGTLEYDRITLPSPAAERIVSIDVREGQRVRAGQSLLALEPTRTEAATRAAEAEAARQAAVLSELETGPRTEQIAQARAQLAAAQALEREASMFYARLRPLGRRQYVAAEDVDRARASAEDAQAQVRAAQQALLELEHGTRVEQVAQGRAALQAAHAQAVEQQATLAKLHVVAPRDAWVDSLPYRLGDQAPLGGPLAILLVGDAPYARIYVPEPIRTRVHVGDRVSVHVDGHDGPLHGTVRMIRSEPSFTPYYALTGDDATRLVYLAEVALAPSEARGLPSGFPVRVEFAR
jgi:HlyD family secretion protein